MDGLSGIRVYSGIWNCITKTYQDEGARGFFRGMSSTLIRSFPVNAVTFSVVTWILQCSTPHSNESSNVTYQDASSLQMQRQESLVVQDQPVNRPQQHETIFVAEWQHFGVSHLGLATGTAAAAAVGLFPVRNYAIHSRCSDWIGNALAWTSFSNFYQVPTTTAPPPPVVHCECRESEESKTRRSLLSSNTQTTNANCPICLNPSHVKVTNCCHAMPTIA